MRTAAAEPQSQGETLFRAKSCSGLSSAPVKISWTVPADSELRSTPEELSGNPREKASLEAVVPGKHTRCPLPGNVPQVTLQ